MKPVLSGHRIKRTPSIKRTVAEVPKFISLIYFKWNLYEADTSIKRTRTPKKYLKWSFLLLLTCIKWTLVIKFHHPTCRHWKCKRLPRNTFKNLSWQTYLISFTILYCFLLRFVCTELVSLIWFLQIWVAIYVYGGTMINWFTLIKKSMQTYIVIVSGSIVNVSTVHLNGIWHLIWCSLSKPVLGGHPVLSGHYSVLQGCQLNTGFTVFNW